MNRLGPPRPSPVPRGNARATADLRDRERERDGRTAAGTHDADAARTPVELRLAIGRDGLGLELAKPARLACLDVVELVIRLPHVKFPFDVSGGVAKFRHKRGELERLHLEVDARRFARWAEPRLRGLLAAGPATVVATPRAYGVTITVHARTSVSRAAPRGRSMALAFELYVVPSGGDVGLVVHGARGAHLVEPATTLALRAMTALVGDAARREGSRFVVSDAAARLARTLLPDAGVRAPGAEGVHLAGSGESDGVLFVAFAQGAAPAKLPAEATLAAEAALLTQAADDARMVRDLDRARQLDVAALERAPRHPEIARRIAEVDRAVAGRAEAANAILREVGTPVHLGLLGGDLLAEAGDVPSAIAALLRTGETEPSPTIGALAYARAAELAHDDRDALEWLDAAVARAPRLAELRWERARLRIAAGRLADARADFQELEALAHGARDRHDVMRRAADVYRAAGLGADAAALYERALVYRPDDPEALAGLGAALAAEGRAARGAAILADAIAAAETKQLQTAWMHLELGRILGEGLGDRPAAVARLRAVPDDAPEAIAARGLEGRMRAHLGDVAGASIAYARMRERAGKEVNARAWLEEAAAFEEKRGDLHAAQRHLAAAIGIAPADAALEERYRAVGQTLAARAGVRDVEPRAPEVHELAAAVAPSAAAEVPVHALPGAGLAPVALLEAAPEESPAAPLDEAAAEARVESLTRTLQGDPTNDAVVDELSVLLTRLGRSMDLLALLSARLEDAPPDRREALLPRHREVLATLEREARDAGRDAEADLFKMAREVS